MLRRLPERLRAWLGTSLRRPVLLGITLTLVVLGAGALLVTSAGLVSIAASSGHWPVTSWFLHYSMRRAVSTQSLGIKVPDDLTDPALILKGAGHYETGCVMCHGAPGRDQSVIVEQLTPRPPYLAPRMDEWAPRELFWIVRHGIKFTAMPAWPAQQRDDEVWAVVAFLSALPDMSPQRYRRLALGKAAQNPGATETSARLSALSDPLEPVLATCARCHGEQGAGRGLGAYPSLAGQKPAYLLASLRAYASGERASGIMLPIAAGLEDDMMRQLADHYAQQPAVARLVAANGSMEPADGAIARGRVLATRGSREHKIPSCVQCHGPSEIEHNRMYPLLAGQYPDYLALQLRLFAAGERGGTDYADLMHSATRRLTEQQIRDLAAFYASLAPTDEPQPGLGNPAEL